MICTLHELTNNDAITKRGPPIPQRERLRCRGPCERCPETLHWLRDDRQQCEGTQMIRYERSSHHTCAPFARIGQKMHQTGGRSSPRSIIWDMCQTHGGVGPTSTMFSQFSDTSCDVPLSASSKPSIGLSLPRPLQVRVQIRRSILFCVSPFHTFCLGALAFRVLTRARSCARVNKSLSSGVIAYASTGSVKTWSHSFVPLVVEEVHVARVLHTDRSPSSCKRHWGIVVPHDVVWVEALLGEQ